MTQTEKNASIENEQVILPTFDQLMWPTVKALKALGGSGTNREIYDKIVELEGYSEELQQVPSSSSSSVNSKLEYRSYWARTYLKKFSAIENSRRAVWVLLDKGEKLTEKDVEEIPAVVRRQYKLQREAQQRVEDQDSEDIEEVGFTNWKEELLSTVKKIEPDSFERLCQRVLRENGFTKVEVTGRSGDGGIDGVGILRVNLLSFHVSFQCKRYQGSVGSRDIRDFRGAMIGRGDKGLFITTGNFTADARKEASRDGAPAIDLIDGEELCGLLKDLKLGVEVEMIEEVKITPEWFNKI